jgi:hypothetical protein
VVDADSRWEQMFREQLAREAEEQKRKDQEALKLEVERMREIVKRKEEEARKSKKKKDKKRRRSSSSSSESDIKRRRHH